MSRSYSVYLGRKCSSFILLNSNTEFVLTLSVATGRYWVKVLLIALKKDVLVGKVARDAFEPCGPRSRDKALVNPIRTPLKDWHGGFQTWSMEAAAFHFSTAADWTDVHFGKAHQWNELLQWGRSPRNRGCKRCSNTHQQIFLSVDRLTTDKRAGSASKQHGTEWSDSGNLRIFTSNGSSHLDLEKRGGQLGSSTSIGYVSIMSKKQRQDKLTDIQTATQENPAVVQKCTYCWTIKGLWDLFFLFVLRIALVWQISCTGCIHCWPLCISTAIMIKNDASDGT